MLPAPTKAGYCAGMASCAAIAMRAAMQGIAITTLEVKVESDSDARGLVRIPDAPTAIGDLRMSIRIGGWRRRGATARAGRLG